MKKNIFDLIENFSYKLSDKTVSKYENLSDEELKEEKEIWDYFYFLILSQIFTFSFIFIFGIVFNYIKVLLFSILSFIFLRTKSGGYHCDSFQKCFITTNLSFIIIGLLGNIFYIYLNQYYIILSLISIIFAIYIIPSCPLPWGNEESRGEEEDKKFQKQYKNRVIILYLINLFFIFLNIRFNLSVEFINIGISFGIILASFSGSYFGSSLLDKIWNKFL